MAATAREQSSSNGAGPGPGARASLDALLADASLSRGRRFLPGGAALRAGAKLALRPDRVARRAGGVAAELTRVAAGRSELAPPKSDRRWADPAWQESWLHRRVLQSYLVAAEALDGLVGDAGLDIDRERRLRFAVENILGALAPANFPWSNPAALKAAIDSGGLSYARGARNLLADLTKPPYLPSMVSRDDFEVGEDLAV
ncbi:MAG TPA: hypothetical protein VGI54_06225, partial [Solirubrobacteraceae bacterium]